MNTTYRPRKLLTTDQMQARMRRTDAARTARAQMRVQVAAELGLSPFCTAVRREAHKRVREVRS